MKILYLFADSTARKEMLHSDYNTQHLYGQDYATRYGFSTLDDLDICDRTENNLYGKIVDFIFNKICVSLGGWGGSWHKVFSLKQKIARADIILSTADRVGIPLVFLQYLKLVPKKPVIYVSIGLFEKLKKLKPHRLALYQKVFAQNVQKIICYGYVENLKLKKIFGEAKVQFIPFGVDTQYFQPQNTEEDNYLLSIGKDPNRDFDLLLNIARFIKEKILLITSKARKQEIEKRWKVIPHNVSIVTDVPLSKIRASISHARLVILPVKENSYSGATTTLLQTMAMGKAVVVTKTGAIKKGYHLEHNKNCILVQPGNKKELLQAIRYLLKNVSSRKNLGDNARKTVQEYLSWENYVHNLFSVIRKSL